MLLIQKLIKEVMAKEGKSLSDIARDTGLPKSSISNYYNNKSKPEGKSLAVLAEYFKCEFHELLEPVDPESGMARYLSRNPVTEESKSPRQMFAGDLFASLPDVDQEDIIAIMIERKHRLAGQTE